VAVQLRFNRFFWTRKERGLIQKKMNDVGVDEVRLTEEYAAAFDLEVWKAQQRQVFRRELDVERERMVLALQAEFHERELKRISEIDHLRAELEAMAQRLQQSGKALKKRVANHERREEAFDQRRLEISREHEARLHDVESKTRRLLDEANAKVDLLNAELRDRDIVNHQLHERLAATQNEYDQLQRMTSRLQANEGSQQKVAMDLQRELQQSSADAQRLTAELDRTRRLLEDAVKEKKQVAAAAHFYKQQLMRLADKYNALTEEYHRQFREQLEEDKRKLEQLKQQDDFVRNRGRRGLPSSDVLSGMVMAPQGPPEMTELQRMVEQLRAISLAERKADRKRRRKAEKRTARPTIVYAEVAQPSTQTPRGNGPLRPPDAVHDISISSMSSKGEGEGAPLSAPIEGRQWAEDEAAQLSTHDASADSIQYVSAESWLPTVSASLESNRKSPDGDGRVEASSLSACSTLDSAAEIRQFLSRLRQNRDQLLSSGVYEPGDPIIVEMDRKIYMYEYYLRVHFES
jgi:hypothetical protein